MWMDRSYKVDGLKLELEGGWAEEDGWVGKGGWVGKDGWVEKGS